jgi:hypothetical protein
VEQEQLSRKHAGLFDQSLTTDINETTEASRAEDPQEQGELQQSQLILINNAD